MPKPLSGQQRPVGGEAQPELLRSIVRPVPAFAGTRRPARCRQPPSSGQSGYCPALWIEARRLSHRMLAIAPHGSNYGVRLAFGRVLPADVDVLAIDTIFSPANGCLPEIGPPCRQGSQIPANRPIYSIPVACVVSGGPQGYAARFCLPDICLTARTHSCFAESSPVQGAECQAVTPTKVLSRGPNAITLRCA